MADEAFGVVLEVMRGKIFHEVTARLQAARYVREEVCGAIPQKTEINVIDNLAERMKQARERRESGS